MRSLKSFGPAALAAALLCGCQINAPIERKFSSPIFSDFSDTQEMQDRNRPPYVMSFPDETMFFYPIYDRPLRSDLNLRAIGCSRASDGTLVVNARIQNLGADVIPPREQLYGLVSSFRVRARVTWSTGVSEDVYASLPIPMGVSAVFNVETARTHYFAKDVTRIDVVVDPDQVVPDPVRYNNLLTWQGTMNPDVPNCDIVRS